MTAVDNAHAFPPPMRLQIFGTPGYAEFDCHSLRHTHATELSKAGVNIKEIWRRLGHSTLEITTRRDIHATDRMEQESIDIMNRVYGCESCQSQEKVRLRLVN